MSPTETPQDEQRQSSKNRLGTIWREGLDKGKTELLKGKLQLQHGLGLGPKPNVVPPGEADIHGDLRLVEVGWHPVGGLGGKWFAEQTRLGKMITNTVHKYPDPTQHWAVLVGEYCHELWMDEHLNVIYINEKIDRGEWHTFDVGQTRFNDEALRQTGEMVIHNMRQTKPAYNLISNNCQTFAVSMLDAIQIGAHREFATSFAVYQRMTGKGKIKDLFVDKHPEEQEEHHAPMGTGMGMGTETGATGVGANMGQQPGGGLRRQQTVQQAQQVMEDNTTTLDTRHHS